MQRKLFVDLGHSKRWPGAVGIKAEVDWNRAIWASLQPMLQTLCAKKGWTLIPVPTNFLIEFSANNNLVQRIKWINARSKPSDLLLSIHGNAATNPNVSGVTTCFMGGSESARLEAIKLSQAYSQATGVPVWNGGAFDDRNGRFGRIGMVRDTTPFALLIEAGFVTNRQDMTVETKKAAEGIVRYYESSGF
jgi:N-acetylmuramoyl-L-alanine amidase